MPPSRSDGRTVCVITYAPTCGITHWNRPSVKCTACSFAYFQPPVTGTQRAEPDPAPMSDREAKVRAVKFLAKSIYRDLEAQGFDEKQIVSLATELISEVTNKISRGD